MKYLYQILSCHFRRVMVLQHYQNLLNLRLVSLNNENLLVNYLKIIVGFWGFGEQYVTFM